MDMERLTRLIIESDTPNTTLLFELLAYADRTNTSPLPPADMEVLRAQAWYMADDPYRLAQANIERAPMFGPAPWCAFAWCDFTGFTVSPPLTGLNRDVWITTGAWDRHRARTHALIAINVEVNIPQSPHQYLADGPHFPSPSHPHAMTVPVSAFALTPDLYWRAELDSLRLLRDDQAPRSRLHGVLYLLAQRLALSPHADNWVLCVLHGKYHMPFLVRMNPWCVVWVADDMDGKPSLQGGPGEMRHSVSIDPLNHLFRFFNHRSQFRHTEEIIDIVNYFVATLPKLHRPPEKGGELTAAKLINLTHHSIYRITEQTQRNNPMHPTRQQSSDPFQHALSVSDTIDSIRRQMRG